MTQSPVLEVLLYTQDGEEYAVRPRHTPECMVMLPPPSVGASFCEGCRVQLLAEELLLLVRPEVVDVNLREGVPNEDCR